jgi:selenocysteine-specific elongation factor
LAAAQGLADHDARVRLAACIGLRRELSLDAASESWIGLTPAQCEAAVEQLVARGEIVRTAGRQPVLVTAERFELLERQLVRHCQLELERRRPTSQVPLPLILSAMSRTAGPQVLEAVVQTLTARGELLLNGDRVGLPTGADLSHRQRSMLSNLMADIERAGATPPTLRELSEQHDYALQDLEPLVQVAVDQGRLVRLSPQLVISRGALETLRQRLAEDFQKHPTGTVSQIRERWQMTRKHAVPILEFFDQRRITARSGDNRSAGPRISSPLDEAVV